jgi:hypothetical protein
MAAAAKFGSWTFWVVMTLLSLGVGGYAIFLTVTGFEMVGTEIKANSFFSPLGLQTHIVASSLAIITGPFQFLPALRRHMPAVHRWMGRFYIAACLVGGVAGGSIALFTAAGPVAGIGFLGLAIAWVVSTVMAFRYALKRDFAAHERWMIRSFALTLAAVTLRLYLPPVFIFGWEFFPAYRIIAWACWVPNLLIAELFIASKRRPRVRPAAA